MSESQLYYVGDLGNGQQVLIEQQGPQTCITLSSSTSGQSQRQSNRLQIGEWTKPPVLFKGINGLVLRIETSQGQTFFQLQSNSTQPLTTIPSLQEADIVPLRQVSRETASDAVPSMLPMQPVQPIEMKPLKLGDMTMQMNPMQMRMGNMEMRMDDRSSPQSQEVSNQKRFCSQCGQPVEADDRFCSYCGHQIQTAH